MRGWFVFYCEPGEPTALVSDCVEKPEAVRIARRMRTDGCRYRVGWYRLHGMELEELAEAQRLADEWSYMLDDNL